MFTDLIIIYILVDINIVCIFSAQTFAVRKGTKKMTYTRAYAIILQFFLVFEGNWLTMNLFVIK